MALEIFNALRGAKNTIGAIDSKLATLRAERAKVGAAPPHIDDVKAWALRGLDSASEHFLGRLRRWHFNDEALAKWSGSTLDGHAGPQLLGITATVPGHVCPAPGNIAHDMPPADIAAVTHFLRPAIEKELPALIEQAFPGSRKGMRSSERVAKLAKLDRQIATLEAERNEYVVALRDAQKAIDTPANTMSTDDPELAHAIADGLVINAGE
jgi:hypothetical protein